MKKNTIYIFLHFMENKNINNILKSHLSIFIRIIKMWQHAVIPIFFPRTRTYREKKIVHYIYGKSFIEPCMWETDTIFYEYYNLYTPNFQTIPDLLTM